MRREKTGSGAATAAGITFQENVAAWLVCQILAGPNRTNDLELPADALLETITCESLEPIDDIVVRATDRTLYFQCKTTLSFGSNSIFVKVIQQFAEQFLKPGCSDDRYVIAVSDTASNVLRTSLRSALKLLRGKRGAERADELKNHRSIGSQYGILEAVVLEQLQLLQRGKPVDEEEVYAVIDRVVIYAAPFGAGECRPDAATDKLALVLTRPEYANRAWERIVSMVRGFSPNRTGGNRHTFVQGLRNEGYISKPLGAVREAINALQARNRDYLAKLARHALIKFGDLSTAEIDRPIVKLIYEELTRDSLLLCGEAGSGKTGCLVQVARLLDQQNTPILVLPVERIFLGADSHSSIGIPAGCSLEEVLNGWPTDKSGVVCLDGLDAARSSVSLRSVLDFVHQLRTAAPNWKILASIREFDLEKSDEIQRIFRGTVSKEVPASHVTEVRAIRIPELSDEEFAQLYRKIPSLETLLEEDHAVGLRLLARNVFNLDLLVDMLSLSSAHELQRIDTQDKLLETYWSLRVGDDATRTSPLEALTRKMVEERRVAVHINSETSARLSELFSNSVLTREPGLLPEDPELVRYRHNILFDYALARLWLRGLSDQLVLTELARSPDLVLVFLPSLRMTLQRLWRKDPSRKAFWQRVAKWFQTETITDIAKFSVKQVAAEEFRETKDVAPLFDGLEDPIRAGLLEGSIAAALMQLHVDLKAFDVIGPNAAPWLPLTQMLAKHDAHRFSYTLRNVLVAVIEGGSNGCERLTNEQKMAFTSVACGLLNAYLDEGNEYVVRRELLGVAVRGCIIATSWDAVRPIAALRRALAPEVLAFAGFVILPLLGDQISALASIDESFSEQVFEAYSDIPAGASNPITSFGGPILPMTSTAAQDLSMFEYSAGKVFEELVMNHPDLAARVMRLIMQHHWMSRESSRTRIPEDRTRIINFDGAKRKLILDYSYIWDSNQTYDRHKLWRKAADTLFAILEADTTSEAIRQALFNAVLTNADLGAIWSRLLLAGATLPVKFGERLAPLLTQTVFLREWETRHAVGNLLEHRFETWSMEIREQIESAIMQVEHESQHFADDAPTAAKGLRDSLISCLPEAAIVTQDVRFLSARIRSDRSAIPPSAPFRVTSGFISNEDHLRERGQLRTVAQRRFFELHEEVKRLGRSNESLVADDVPHVLKTILDYEAALVEANSDAISKEQTEYAEGEIAAVFSNLAEVEATNANTRNFTLQRLLEFSTHPEPIPCVDEDDCWDSESPHWGSPFPRIESAWGLMRIVRHSKAIDESTRTAILRLAGDLVPAVRYPIIAESGSLYVVAPADYWKLIEERVQKEEKLALLRCVVLVVLGFSPKSEHANRVDRLIRGIELRIANRESAGFVRKAMVVHHLRRWIYLGDKAAKSWLEGIVDCPFERPEELSGLLQLWEELLSEPKATDVLTADEIVSYGIQTLIRAFDASRVAWSEQPWVGLNNDDARSEHQRASGPMQHVVDIVSLLLDRHSHPDQPAPRSEHERISRMVQMFRGLIEKCATVPMATDAYDFLRTLQYISPVVPADALLWVHTLIRSAAPQGFLNDQMGADLLIGLLERYLVEHRDLLSVDPATRDSLIDLLNDCVHYGWPKAGPLLVRLHEVFRG